MSTDFEPNSEHEKQKFLAANRYADSDQAFMGQQRTFQAWLAGCEWGERRFKALMQNYNWDGVAWTMRPTTTKEGLWRR